MNLKTLSEYFRFVKKIHPVFRLAFFWLLYFALFRLAFVLFYKSELPPGQLSDTLKAFPVALRIDTSVACYLIIIPFIIYVLMLFFHKGFLKKILDTYHLAIICICSLLNILNIYIYQQWGTMINARIFMYAKYVKEDLSFVNNKELTLLMLSWLGSTALFYWLYKVIAPGTSVEKLPASGRYIRRAPSGRGAVINFLLIPLIIIGMRGGLQFTPMNESIIYYSAYPINNTIAANVPWHLGYSWLDESDTKNPFIAMPEKKAKEIVHNMMEAPLDSTTGVLNAKRPNVVIIMLESWTADVIKELGGDTATTPCYDTLRKHGLLFTQAYASGSRTDQGLASIISGFPSQPNRSIVDMPEKSVKLPCITDAFVKLGYHFSYYHGGDADFQNMKIYLLHAHFSKIVDKRMFSSGESNGRLGINDEYVFNRQLQEMNREQQPFFSLIMTLSSHPPYEVPCHHSFTGRDDIYEKFRNAVYYSDSCLGKYLAEASKQKWFDSTLYILVSDHGNHLPMQRNAYSPEAHHIGIMFYGGALKKEYRGKEINVTTDQCDIATMLYSQLHLDHSEFPWSKDVLNPSVKDFAVTSNDVEAGIISGDQHLTYSFSPYKIRDFYVGKIPADSLAECARAWLQLYYQQYLDY